MSYPRGYSEAAKSLLLDLESARLEVALIGGRRMAVGHNAEWYQRFCWLYLSSRKRYPKLRTIIKRCHTATALRRIIDGTADLNTGYVKRLCPFLEELTEYKERQ